jgi:hypothetical protein
MFAHGRILGKDDKRGNAGRYRRDSITSGISVRKSARKVKFGYEAREQDVEQSGRELVLRKSSVGRAS